MYESVYVCVCLSVFVRACVRACMRECVYVRVCMSEGNRRPPITKLLFQFVGICRPYIHYCGCFVSPIHIYTCLYTYRQVGGQIKTQTGYRWLSGMHLSYSTWVPSEKWLFSTYIHIQKHACTYIYVRTQTTAWKLVTKPIYIYIYIHTHTHPYICRMHTQTNRHTYTFEYIDIMHILQIPHVLPHTHTQTDRQTDRHLHIHVLPHTHRQTDICTYMFCHTHTHTHTHTYICTYIQTYIYTYMQILLTNPPYSTDHFEKIVKFAAASVRWVVLRLYLYHACMFVYVYILRKILKFGAASPWWVVHVCMHVCVYLCMSVYTNSLLHRYN
jgi:hypothetical protein